MTLCSASLMYWKCLANTQPILVHMKVGSHAHRWHVHYLDHHFHPSSQQDTIIDLTFTRAIPGRRWTMHYWKQGGSGSGQQLSESRDERQCSSHRPQKSWLSTRHSCCSMSTLLTTASASEWRELSVVEGCGPGEHEWRQSLNRCICISRLNEKSEDPIQDTIYVESWNYLLNVGVSACKLHLSWWPSQIVIDIIICGLFGTSKSVYSLRQSWPSWCYGSRSQRQVTNGYKVENQ